MTIIHIWLISGLLSLWYFIRVSKHYPEFYDWNGIPNMTVGDIFVIMSLITGGCVSLSFVILILFIKIKDFKLFK